MRRRRGRGFSPLPPRGEGAHLVCQFHAASGSMGRAPQSRGSRTKGTVMAKNKHLTDIERLEIEHGLRHRLSLKKIAAKIGKHHSTVAREIPARIVAS